ncbi:hypothetical protein PoMZ_07898 [Pyricularia oryzae]|uniref:Uncharacterized protein n=1 Tax=Pyricularia oryzae TaxID=318829 RepID=A0A4P7NGD0_PYROR|nr:hypothetical protein PoMZ_07898 [Pyricularia oryzae]
MRNSPIVQNPSAEIKFRRSDGALRLYLMRHRTVPGRSHFVNHILHGGIGKRLRRYHPGANGPRAPEVAFLVQRAATWVVSGLFYANEIRCQLLDLRPITSPASPERARNEWPPMEPAKGKDASPSDDAAKPDTEVRHPLKASRSSGTEEQGKAPKKRRKVNHGLRGHRAL